MNENLNQDVDLNPFGKEKAWDTWQKNMKRARKLREEIAADSGGDVRRQLLRTVEAIGCLTDNTIFLKIVRKALEARNTP